MSRTMRAAMLRGKEDVVMIDVPVPEPGPGEIVIRVEAALTCGTDAKVFKRGYHARMLTPPCLFGHEYTGIVEAAGAGVTAFRAGDPVVGANSAPCGECDWCRRGRESLCDDLVFVNGAFAERLLLPERIVRRNLYHRFPGLAPVVAAASEPVACVLKGVETIAPAAGESALILGAGPVALVFAAELRTRGVTSVVFARHAEATATARAMGVLTTIVAASVAAARPQLLAASPRGDGFDMVVEAAAAADTSEAAPTLCTKGGRVLLFGGCAGDVRITVDPSRLHYDEVQILSSFHHTPRHVEQALEALASGRITVGPLLESPVGLDGVAESLRRMCRRDIRGKVPVLPGGVPRVKKPVVIAVMALFAASIATLVSIAKTAGEVAHPADATPFGAMLDRAAAAAGGQRVLAIVAPPGTTPLARVFETGRAPEGRRCYAATFDPADPLAQSLQVLAYSAAADFLPDRKLDETTLKALSLFGVSILAATDGTSPILPEVGERDPAASPAPGVPGLRITQAQPAFQFLAEEPSIAVDDPVGFRRAVRVGAALFRETDDDHAPWSYALTIEAAVDSEFLLGRGTTGARVTIDGEPATIRAAKVPVMLVKVPKGAHRVVIEYGERRAVREWLAVVAAAVAVASLIALWLGLRPRVEETG